jgi:hypothetical protein
LSAIFGQAAEVVACRIILKARLIDLDYTLLYYPPGEEATLDLLLYTVD